MVSSPGIASVVDVHNTTVRRIVSKYTVSVQVQYKETLNPRDRVVKLLKVANGHGFTTAIDVKDILEGNQPLNFLFGSWLLEKYALHL